MTERNLHEKINGISVCNPVDVDRDYLIYTVEYAHKMGFNHIQYTGPIHDSVKGNIDGMTPYRKYNQFNNSKNLSYVEKSVAEINEACEKAYEYGIKMFAWHHELELPPEFSEVFPETVNSYGDIEITHPIVRDFLENKILDFFAAYPKMDGIILTLHETKIPILKLKNQKLSKVERVKYVTKILYDTCKLCDKELIVRPFASLEEDYEMMARAYEEISTDLVIMDKWTQFDWSLTLPHNKFFKKIKKNPIVAETDIFGEYFGKGKLPLMLKNHIERKYRYCETFSPQGYVSRIDRDGEDSFGDVNEVNTIIINAHINNQNVEQAIDDFFARKYPEAPDKVRNIMEGTENVLIKFMYLDGYYFHQQSLFPELNHCKNHYYFEIMKEHSKIDSDEWYIPSNWKNESPEKYIAEKESAVADAEKLLEQVIQLENIISREEYEPLWVKFTNLKYVTQIWLQLMWLIINYVKYFETKDNNFETALKDSVKTILEIEREGVAVLGDKFYCSCGRTNGANTVSDLVKTLTDDLVQSFEIEKSKVLEIEKEPCLIDYVVCGGAMESHCLQKEVNFSDTLMLSGALCRIPGNRMGMKWSSINAHGWFSYLLKVAPHKENVIRILMGCPQENLDVRITVGNKEIEIHEKARENIEVEIRYTPEGDDETVRIRFDKISANTPCIYTIKVL